MVITIKDVETDPLAREPAAGTDESITVASGSDQDLGEFISRGRERVSLDQRAADEIIGYDEHGLPQ